MFSVCSARWCRRDTLSWLLPREQERESHRTWTESKFDDPVSKEFLRLIPKSCTWPAPHNSVQLLKASEGVHEQWQNPHQSLWITLESRCKFCKSRGLSKRRVLLPRTYWVKLCQASQVENDTKLSNAHRSSQGQVQCTASQSAVYYLIWFITWRFWTWTNTTKHLFLWKRAVFL